MLDYMNILTMPDKEIRDPISGYSYPMSYNDIKAAKRQQAEDAIMKSNTKALAGMLSSILK